MLRKKYLILLFILFSFLFGSCVHAIPRTPKYIPGEIIIKFQNEAVTIPLSMKASGQIKVNSSSIKNLNSKHKIKQIRKAFKNTSKGQLKKILRSGKTVTLPDLSNIYILDVSSEADIKAIIKEYKKDPDVIYAEPNYLFHALIVTPDDDFYDDQWALPLIGLSGTGSGESGWDIFTGGTGTNLVTVAVVDTGAKYDHPDLNDRIDLGYDFVNNDNDPMDDHYHGTHVSGIIGAETNNNEGVSGTDWNCRILAIKCLDSNGDGSSIDIANGIIYAVDNDADIINMSFGGYGQSSSMSEAISYATTSEVVLIAAAGNDNITVQTYPANYSGVIAVAAIDRNNIKTDYSNYGSWIDISAPGGNIPLNPDGVLSTFFVGSTNNYSWSQGTSMASPFVAGVAALIKGQNPSWTKTQIDDHLLAHTDDIDAINSSYAGLLGRGKTNAFLALGGLHSNIGSPADGATAYNTVSINGTATGEGFNNYKVEYGVGSSPTSWITIENSSSPKLNEELTILDTTGTESFYTVKLIVNDLATTERTVTFKAGASHVPIALSASESGPNPFNPLTQTTLIKYALSGNSDIRLYIFDISGTLIYRMNFASGTEGGNQGTNRIYWNGRSNQGQIVPNGLYLYRIVSGNRTITKGKIIVVK